MANTFVRSRNGGKTFELRIKHPRLTKPVYRSFPSELQAQQAGRSAIAALDRGGRPDWLKTSERNPIPTVAAAVQEYMSAKSVPPEHLSRAYDGCQRNRPGPARGGDLPLSRRLD